MASKSSQAALLAQELASEGSWANAFVPSPAQADARPSGTTAADTTAVVNHQAPADAPPAYEDVARVEPVELPAEPLPTPTNVSPSEATTDDPDDIASLISTLDPNRCYKRHEVHGPISGVFTFQDYLELTADHGSISITLDPMPGDTPAILRLTVTHGAIQVKLSENYVTQMKSNGKLSRPWDVRIRAKTGAVDAKLPIGRGSKYFLKSRWGAVSSTFYVVDPDHNDSASEVTVETHNGAQNIKFTSLLGSIPIRNITGDYHSKVNGAVTVEYPETWEGRIQAKSGRGKVKVKGDRLKIQHYGSKETHASRGVAQQVTLVRCDGSGRAKLVC